MLMIITPSFDECRCHIKKNGARTYTVKGELTRYGHSLMPLEIAKTLKEVFIKN